MFKITQSVLAAFYFKFSGKRIKSLIIYVTIRLVIYTLDPKIYDLNFARIYEN